MIRWGQSAAKIQAEIERLHGTVRMNILMRAGTAKKVQVNAHPIRRLADLFGYVNVVAFTPDDLQLVKGSPSYRRQFLDYEIAQVSPAYRDHLSRYNRILRQRNSLLRSIAEGSARANALQAWEEQFIEHGSRVIAKRAEMIQALMPIAAQIHSRITNGQERLSIMYRPFFADEQHVSDEEGEQCCRIDHVRRVFAETLHRLRHAELRRGTSLVGPQRDDIHFHINDVDTRTYGSQGQQRTTVLSCKLAEIQFMEEQVGEPPILLLDDVMSELDTSRREFLVDVVKNRVQTFITSAHAGDVGEDRKSVV